MKLLSTLSSEISSIAASEAISSSESGGGTKSNIGDTLKNLVKNPVFYVVIGIIVALIVGVYLYKRFVKARPGYVAIITRKKQIYRILDENAPSYFMLPFKDKLGAMISLNEIEFSSDKLFINNGPDALYKINYTLKYKVKDPEKFFPYVNSINSLLPAKINDELREFADASEDNALTLVKHYRVKNKDILGLLNKAAKEYHIQITSFKVNLVEPMGK